MLANAGNSAVTGTDVATGGNDGIRNEGERVPIADVLQNCVDQIGDLDKPITVGQLIQLMALTRKATVSEVSSYHDEKLEVVMGIVNQLKTATEELSTKTSKMMDMAIKNTRTGTVGSSRKSSGRKRKAPEAVENLEHLNLITSVDKTQFCMRWLSIFTLHSFARMYPGTAAWLPNETKAGIAPRSALIGSVSGLSLLFFSCQDSNWSRYQTSTGKLFTFFVASIISSAILEVRRTEFGPSRGRQVPEWMNAFGGAASTSRYCSDFCTLLDMTKKLLMTLNDTETIMSAKRARGENMPDKFRKEKDFAVWSVRQIIRVGLSYGRTEGRKHILEGFIFLIDKIMKGYDSRRDAAEDGYSIAFIPEMSEAENIVPAKVLGTIWDISNAEASESDDRTNMSLLGKLAGDFPSLFLHLKYKRLILAEDGVSKIPASVPKYWKEDEKVSLHEIALKILTSISLAAQNTKLVLRSSKLSLRAVHILAIGLRGLARQQLALEKCALGSMCADALEEDDDVEVVTTRMGSRSNRDKKSTNAVSIIRSVKFTITYKNYLEKVKDEEEKRRKEAESVRSEVGTSPVMTE